MSAQYYKIQSYYSNLIKSLLSALSVDNPTRISVESTLLASDEETDLQPLYRHLLDLIAAGQSASGSQT